MFRNTDLEKRLNSEKRKTFENDLQSCDITGLQVVYLIALVALYFFAIHGAREDCTPHVPQSTVESTSRPTNKYNVETEYESGLVLLVPFLYFYTMLDSILCRFEKYSGLRKEVAQNRRHPSTKIQSSLVVVDFHFASIPCSHYSRKCHENLSDM